MAFEEHDPWVATVTPLAGPGDREAQQNLGPKLAAAL